MKPVNSSKGKGIKMISRTAKMSQIKNKSFYKHKLFNIKIYFKPTFDQKVKI